MNNEHKQQNTMRDAILAKIERGEVNMRPKVFHTIKVISAVVVSFLLLVTSAFLISFVIFSLRASGTLLLLGFGSQGLVLFFALFPWHLLLLEIMLLVLLEILLRQFKFAYRNPLAYVVFAIILLSISTGIIINIFSVHSRLLHESDQRRLPMFGNIYNNIRRPPPDHGVVKGVVDSIGTNTFVIRIGDGRMFGTTTTTIIAPAFVNVDDLLDVGDTVFIAGVIERGQIRAFGITKLLNSDQE